MCAERNLFRINRDVKTGITTYEFQFEFYKKENTVI